MRLERKSSFQLKPIKAASACFSFSFVFHLCWELPNLVQIGHISYAIKKLCPFSPLFSFQLLRQLAQLASSLFRSTIAAAACLQPKREKIGSRLEKTELFFRVSFFSLPLSPNQINHSPFSSSLQLGSQARLSFSSFLIQIPPDYNEKS